MNDNVVPFPRTNIEDIPRALRFLADRLEAGDYGDVDGLYIVIPQGEHTLPALMGFGSDEANRDPVVIGWLEIAKSWLVNNWRPSE